MSQKPPACAEKFPSGGDYQAGVTGSEGVGGGIMSAIVALPSI